MQVGKYKAMVKGVRGKAGYKDLARPSLSWVAVKELKLSYHNGYI